MSEKTAKSVGALISAAGLSSRMGSLKALLPFGGGTMISACVDNMRLAGADKIVVVTGYRAEEIEKTLDGSGCVCLRNPDYATTHMFDSLCIGLEELADYEKVLICPVDAPAVKAETILALLRGAGDFVRPRYEGKAGHPVLLKGDKIPRILSHGGEGGLRGAIESLGLEITEIETGDAGCVMDADTPEDYRRMLEICEKL